MFNLSSAMAGQFVENTRRMDEDIAKLGPNPLKEKREQSS
jgi:coenzyme F420-reducing hydrogenase delta subunit